MKAPQSPQTQAAGNQVKTVSEASNPKEELVIRTQLKAGRGVNPQILSQYKKLY